MTVLELDDLVDVLVRGDESIVLTSTQCLRLSAVPTAVIGLLERPLGRAELAGRLEAIFGAAPDGRLDEIIEELVSQGVLRVGREDVPSAEAFTLS